MFYKAAGKVIGNKEKMTRELGKDPISLEQIEKIGKMGRLQRNSLALEGQ